VKEYFGELGVAFKRNICLSQEWLQAQTILKRLAMSDYDPKQYLTG